MKPITQAVSFFFMTVSTSLAYAEAAEDIAGRAESFEAAFNSGDAGAVASHYTEDAVILVAMIQTKDSGCTVDVVDSRNCGEAGILEYIPSQSTDG